MFQESACNTSQLLQHKFETPIAEPTLHCQQQIWEDGVLLLLNSTFDETFLAHQELGRT